MPNAREWGAIALLNLSSQTTTTQTLTAAVADLASYASDANREMKAVFNFSGVAAMATGFTTVAVTEADTNAGPFTAPNYGTSSNSAALTNGLIELNFRADKRYIRAEVTFTAAPGVTAANISATAFALKREANA